MTTTGPTYDFLIIGGGIFGVYAAIHFAKSGFSVGLIEKEDDLFRKASIVNQARLHGGYHYPRSIATARMSDDHKERFTSDHKDFINFSFEKYYAIEKYGSFTDAAQFERFCDYISIRCDRIHDHPLFNYDRLEALYRTTEYSFDPILIADYYKEQVRSYSNIDIYLQHELLVAETEGTHWRVAAKDKLHNKDIQWKASTVVNATYAGSNAINRLFGLRDIDLMHEISEIVLVSSNKLRDIGLTVMDGPFGSVMPYGRSGLLSVSSVAYTHHKVSYNNLPHFDCMDQNPECRPDFLADCNYCPAQPPSNYRKMLRQMRRYFSDQVDWQYFHSYFTIKSKLRASHIDDARPTEISKLHDNPAFYCIFAGKINSIYETEKISSPVSQ
jgi:glycine/D-amino acid oxidase-like deaminating enzyme